VTELVDSIANLRWRAAHWQRWLVIYAAVASLLQLLAIVLWQPVMFVPVAYWWLAAWVAQQRRNRALDRLREIEARACVELMIRVDDRASEQLERLAQRLKAIQVHLS
jgi:hypothetical protein